MMQHRCQDGPSPTRPKVGSLVAAAEHLDGQNPPSSDMFQPGFGAHGQSRVSLPSIHELTSSLVQLGRPEKTVTWQPPRAQEQPRSKTLMPSYGLSTSSALSVPAVGSSFVTHYDDMRYPPVYSYHRQPPAQNPPISVPRPPPLESLRSASGMAESSTFPLQLPSVTEVSVLDPNQFHFPAPRSPPAGRRTRENLPKPVTQALKQWLFGHANNPYPTDAEKRELCEQHGLTHGQINNWFINARRRYLKKIVLNVDAPQQQQQQPTRVSMGGMASSADVSNMEMVDGEMQKVKWVVPHATHIVGFEVGMKPASMTADSTSEAL